VTCQEFVQFLMDYLEGTLGGRTRGTFEEHMGECPGCVGYLDSYRETIRLGRLCGSPDEPVPEDVPEQLLSAILAARKQQD